MPGRYQLHRTFVTVNINTPRAVTSDDTSLCARTSPSMMTVCAANRVRA